MSLIKTKETAPFETVSSNNVFIIDLKRHIYPSHKYRFRHREAIINGITGCCQVFSFDKQVQSFVARTEPVGYSGIQNGIILFHFRCFFLFVFQLNIQIINRRPGE